MEDYIIYSIYILIVLIILKIVNNDNKNAILISVPHYIKRSNTTSGNEIFNVPLNIYHTWNKKSIPARMKENVNYILNQNPEFDYYLYDDNDCREYIKNNYTNDVLEAFDSLIPGAYKADLWRCCIMYKQGGVYMDIKLKPLIKLKSLIEENNFYFVKDTPSMSTCENKLGIYNAFLISYPNNIIFKLCIDEIVNNCKIKYYGKNTLSITGPCLLGHIFNKHYNNEYELYINLYLNEFDGCIYNKQKEKIIGMYDGYRNDQNNIGTLHYSVMWNQKNIFGSIKNKKITKLKIK